VGCMPVGMNRHRGFTFIIITEWFGVLPQVWDCLAFGNIRRPVEAVADPPHSPKPPLPAAPAPLRACAGPMVSHPSSVSGSPKMRGSPGSRKRVMPLIRSLDRVRTRRSTACAVDPSG